MRQTTLILAIAFCVSTIHGLGASKANATDRYYSDIDATSPSGEFHLEAKSPENRKDRPKAFARNFVFTMVNTKTNKTVWTRTQKEKEGSPVGLYVADDGSSVLVNSWNELTVVRSDGKETGSVNLLDDVMDPTDHERFVIHTSGGPMWERYSHWYFLEDDGAEFFVVRPWWGSHMIIATKTAKIVSKKSDELTRWIEQQEKQFVIDTLSEVTAKNLAKHENNFGVRKAVFLAGKLDVRSVVEQLRIVEQSNYSGRSSSWSGMKAFATREFTLRQLAQLSLRRLGETPTTLPAYEFQDWKSGSAKVLAVPVPTNRHKNSQLIKKGMSAKRVTELLGIPNCISGLGWTYDFDQSPQFSITIRWGFDNEKIEGITKQKPPTWKTGVKRDQEMF